MTKFQKDSRMNNDVIQKPGLILDKILMKFYDENCHDDQYPTDSFEITIQSNNDFSENIKNVDLLTYLNYPSVVNLSQWYLQHGSKSNEVNLTMITKDCQLESLHVLLNGKSTSTDKKLTSTDKIIILYGISKAICYFQSKFVVHNQLNLTNIFISNVDKKRFPKIQNFHKSEVFYNPNEIELNMFLKDLESFRKLLVEILQESEISIEEKIDSQKLCEKIDALKINEKYTDSFKKFIESKKDPVTTMREFVKGIETKNIWLDDVDDKAFSSYKQSFHIADKQVQHDDSDSFTIVQEFSNKSNENLIEMIEKLIKKSSIDDSANFILGICYLKGIGIPQNFGLGYYYISKAEKSSPEAKALKLILEQKATVLKSKETSTTLYQKGQIFECQNTYRKAYATYIKSIKKSIEENKSYIPSFGRIGRFLLNQANNDVKVEMKGIDYLKVGYENDDPYAIYELYLYFEHRKNADVSQQIAEKFRIIHEDKMLTNASDLSQYFWEKAKLLGLPVEKMQTNMYGSP